MVTCRINIVLALLLLAVLGGRVFLKPTVVQPDSPRYLQMGLNFADYGVLTAESYVPGGPVPKPGLALGGPFTAWEIALAAKMSDATKESFQCAAITPDYRTCDMKIVSLQAIYVLEIFIFHMAVWFVARSVFQNDVKAWLATGLSLVFKESGAYVHSILSEPSHMMTVGFFFLAWLYAFAEPEKLKRWFLCGLILGFVALVKPAWSALVPGIAVCGVLYVIWKRSEFKRVAAGVLALTAGTACISLIFLTRNVIQFGFWGLSDPTYLSLSYAYRFTYNAMNWTEWLASWIFFLPDFGDNLTKSLFGQDVVDKLGWGPDSYFIYGRDVLHSKALAASSEKTVSAYLLKNYFFNDIVKSIAVTASLMWRGLFVGNLFGLVAVILAGPMLYCAKPKIRQALILLLLPCLIMVGVHALVSIGITRYSIPLIVPYALILTQVLHVLGGEALRFVPSGLTAKIKTFLPKN